MLTTAEVHQSIIITTVIITVIITVLTTTAAIIIAITIVLTVLPSIITIVTEAMPRIVHQGMVAQSQGQGAAK